MPVRFDGGTSGNREDAKPPRDPAYDKQPIQNTASNACPNDIQYCQNTGTRHYPVTDPPVPCNGSPDDAAV